MAILAILIGIITGVVSGLIGLGGGIFIVPALVYVFEMSQHEAQGTVPSDAVAAHWAVWLLGILPSRAG